MSETVLFYLFSFLAVFFAFGVVTARSAFYGVLSLVATMCSIAGLFVLLKAYFVATILILVYAGAILVLFLFVVMLMDLRQTEQSELGFNFTTFFAGILSLAIGYQIFLAARTAGGSRALAPIHGTAESLGRLLFSSYLLPFELTSLLILAAVVSVVVLAKKDPS